ncbi:MAG TPA: aminotransferase class I/II-fold pyridoxal phosphate-dependent enzyme [Thermoleophilia bacterium]|nr:aminotransferase class I/II-fold pyridoxal phosphate-dependent enzyme [Thermoleophilia bacterium]
MKPLRTFRLEEYLGEWEFKVRHHLTASDAQSMTIAELLALGTEGDREGLMQLPLSYIETWGSPALRTAVAGTYERVDADHVLAFAGAEEGLFWTMQELVGPGDHAVVTVPCYQAMETVTLATGADVSALVPRREHGWALDLDELRGLLRPNTKLVAVNYPNNPTGYVPEEATFRELVALCDERGIRLFCDEVYRGIEVDPAQTITQAADLSETAVSLNVASKSYGLPGLRVGWIACRDRALLERLEKRKHYTSICNAGPAEYLAAVALRHRDAIWERNRGVVAANRPLFDDFFARWSDLFDWRPPDGGCVCFPRYKGGDVEEFCRQLLDAEGVLVLPASMYASEIADVPKDHFRVGIGRLGLEEGLEAFDHFLRAQH